MEDYTYENLIKKVVAFRKLNNLTQQEVSKRLNKGDTFWGLVENGKVELKLQTLLDFCKIVDITLLEFLCLKFGFKKDDCKFLQSFQLLETYERKFITNIIKGIIMSKSKDKI